MEMKTYMYTCSSCGDSKEIYIEPHENPEELEGCMCSRAVHKKKHRIDETSLLMNFKDKSN